MIKTITAVTAFLFISLAGRTQVDDDHFIVIASPQIGFAMGKLQATNAVALGGRLGFDFYLADKIRLTTAIGSITYSGKKYYDPSYGGSNEQYDEYALLQVAAGIKYFYYNGLFVSAQVGGAGSVWKPNTGWGLTYAPALGFEFGDGPYYDISLRYENNLIRGKNGQGIIFTIGYHF